MRHVVNLGLLVVFVALATTGLMLFLQPFSVAVARVHILSGMGASLFVVLHLAQRLGYFRNRWLPNKRREAIKQTFGVTAGLAVLALGAAVGWRPFQQLIELGYESRHRAEIVRSSSMTGFGWQESQTLALSRANDETGHVRLSLVVRLTDPSKPPPALAIWAETSTGSMIETLYLDPTVPLSPIHI